MAHGNSTGPRIEAAARALDFSTHFSDGVETQLACLSGHFPQQNLPKQPIQLWLVSGQLEPASPVRPLPVQGHTDFFFAPGFFSWQLETNRHIQSGVLNTMKWCETTIQDWEGPRQLYCTLDNWKIKSAMLLAACCLLRYFRIFVWKLSQKQLKTVHRLILDDLLRPQLKGLGLSVLYSLHLCTDWNPLFSTSAPCILSY